MCTSLTLETADRKHVLARTMDFAFQLGTEVILYPRRYIWNSEADGKYIRHSTHLSVWGENLEIYYLQTALMKAVYRVLHFIFRAMRSTKKRYGKIPFTLPRMSL